MTGPGSGRLVWEVLETSTGQVRGGHRDLRPTDFEVIVSPPPDPPRFDLLRLGPRQIAADAVGWLAKGGRGSTTKRVRLGDGFWLILRERQSPSRPSLLLLTAKRDGARTSCVEWFEIDGGATTANEVEGPGVLELEWASDQEFQELASTSCVTDVSFHLRSAAGPLRRDPLWRVRLQAGSVVRWPQSAGGVRLVPRLRPDR